MYPCGRVESWRGAEMQTFLTVAILVNSIFAEAVTAVVALRTGDGRLWAASSIGALSLLTIVIRYYFTGKSSR